MQRIVTSGVGVVADLDHGEGWISFSWHDPIDGSMCLMIDADGFCSREMPVRSGPGPPRFVAMSCTSLVLRFDFDLASKLGLNEELEFEFALDDKEFHELKEAIETWFGLD